MNLLKKHPSIVGVCITVIFLILGFIRFEFIDTLELKFYDLRMKYRAQAEKPDEIVIVDIDNDSIEKMGRWPWPRSHIARGINKIAEGDPKVIGLNILFSEEEENSGLKVIDYLAKIIQEKSKDPDVLKAMDEAKLELDNDTKLVNAIENAGMVILPVFFREAMVQEKTDTDKMLQKFAVQKVSNPNAVEIPEAPKIIVPIPRILNTARGIGHVNLINDADGKVRNEQLIFEYQGMYIPSFSLRLSAIYLGLSNNQIGGVLGSKISLGGIDIPTNKKCEMLVSFKGPQGAFKNRFSFFDVINDKIPLSIFKNKIVLITPSAEGITNPINTPAANIMSIGEYTANAVWTILNKNFIRQPSWGFIAEIILILIIGGIISFLIPRLKALFAGICFVVLLGGLVMTSGALFISKGLWMKTTYPLLQLIIGYIGVVTFNYFIAETDKERVEGESAETNRMLGLSFQNQGMLDMAFDKFRRVPVDEEVKDILYNLGLDYERKRQFNKAASVYDYIGKHDPDYRDIAQKKQRLLKASETMVFGEGFLGSGSTGDGLISEGTDTRPTLGRYEIMRQLGKGAMGVVYLGQDPRINRTTAIKTFKFAENFDPEEAEKLKEKFFREAESAGTLSHPNIVTIYDAGEEQDLAYIAMEYLEGDDLQKYTKKKNLLPSRKVIDIIADVADALDYAHNKGIVHRDIKPANVMLLKSEVVKVTDFGIARITATSQTQTGVVKGTPHYMSPEQISGEKVDGRSDIFSLGVTMYQLLTGEVPFSGNSPAALMHQIMNVNNPDPREINPRLTKAHAAIINKALEKDRNKRYQQAAQMAAHLRMLGQKLDALKNKKAVNKKKAV